MLLQQLMVMMSSQHNDMKVLMESNKQMSDALATLAESNRSMKSNLATLTAQCKELKEENKSLQEKVSSLSTLRKTVSIEKPRETTKNSKRISRVVPTRKL